MDTTKRRNIWANPAEAAGAGSSRRCADRSQRRTPSPPCRVTIPFARGTSWRIRCESGRYPEGRDRRRAGLGSGRIGASSTRSGRSGRVRHEYSFSHAGLPILRQARRRGACAADPPAIYWRNEEFQLSDRGESLDGLGIQGCRTWRQAANGPAGAGGQQCAANAECQLAEPGKDFTRIGRDLSAAEQFCGCARGRDGRPPGVHTGTGKTGQICSGFA